MCQPVSFGASTSVILVSLGLWQPGEPPAQRRPRGLGSPGSGREVVRSSQASRPSGEHQGRCAANGQMVNCYC